MILSGLFSGIGVILFSISVAQGVAGISYTVVYSVSILGTIQDYITSGDGPDFIDFVAFGLLIVSGLTVLFVTNQTQKALSVEDQMREELNREMTEL